MSLSSKARPACLLSQFPSAWKLARGLVVLIGVLAFALPHSRLQAQPPRSQDPLGGPIHLSSFQREDDSTVPAPKFISPARLNEQTISGVPLALPPLPQRGQQPQSAVESLIENLGTQDASFEVVLGEGRLLTLKENLALAGKPKPMVAVGDPSVLDFNVVGPRQLRLIGQRLGTTDLSITTADNKTFSFEVQVVSDLNVLRAQMKAMFPKATLKISQVRDTMVVEGEARDSAEVARIMETIRSYLLSVMVSQARKIAGQTGARGGPQAPRGGGAGEPPVPMGERGPSAQPMDAAPEPNQLQIEAKVAEPRVINLIRVPGSQQVLLKVRVAELNRTAMRQIGADFLAVDHNTGAIVGSQIGGTGVAAAGSVTGGLLSGLAADAAGASTTVFGIFQQGGFEIFLSALRKNLILKTLAEPNLVAMSGQHASFLAGGEFPVPVPQVGASGVAPTITVQFKEFGVRLGFVPYILDGDVIRLSVDPEVSSVDFSLGTVLVAGGTPVPGLNTRKAHTTVEMRQGQTLMIAGLLQLTLDGQTQRIPGLGDLPIIGPFFSNTTNDRIEKELVVLVTPYLVEPLNACQVPPTPGDEFTEPNDLEFFFLNRIEGRVGRDFRSTVQYDDPFHLLHHISLEKKYIAGPCGFSD